MTKRKTRQSESAAVAASNKREKKTVVKEQEDESSSSDTVAVAVASTESGEDNAERKALLKALRESSDLPSSYAALKLIRESAFIDSLTEDEEELVENACLAVPYIMSNLTVEHCTRPRSLGGLAFSRAKAENLIRPIFAKMGPACCADNVTASMIEKACKELTNQDARKIIPKLKQVGVEARRKVDKLRKTVKLAPTNPPTSNVLCV